jgi:cellulose biosynthesis protein BcsQ
VRSIAFFNNKGGVGKTTLVCNIASQFATNYNHMVLLIDCDPQCNSTQLILDESRWEKLYWPPTDHRSPKQTLLDVVRPIELGEPSIDPKVAPIPPSVSRFNMSLLPGHPRMAIVEDQLSQAWTETLGGRIGGLRTTNWTQAMLGSFASRFDFVFFDLGPSLGSLNRSVLLACDYFVTPMGADIFSIVGLRNIHDWIANWSKGYLRGVEIAQADSASLVAQFDLRETPAIQRGFVGYTVQQYITRTRRGERRATRAFENVLEGIPDAIKSYMSHLAQLPLDELRLGDVPNMFSLVPMAQSAHAPIGDLNPKDGLVGAQYSQAKRYADRIGEVGNKLAQNLRKLR